MTPAAAAWCGFIAGLLFAVVIDVCWPEESR